ncbi:bifunctional 4-hydroxy-2-oxoglutarate aldolase/2-dehydro-3-deoxy-phosphogluconate aldolase [Pelagibius sp. Alg239-R121]|uniref:bifunctional 4-hydroxy-2-oxoglutarate aldolase/2-dehydro-3-deoxy-phosphogluconate aldolase n=1 Tax=Pelagibius sp. Alg239-R121 TaxID=2993448 RepID=UPI0024A6A84C|nr:bifunctional 4-hydroxy-2-oxoglutarate aldolase/2-dehydro-3-deoxy-phosphogluconate aldolase [Pelagibius sp. Alg239-R121]
MAGPSSAMAEIMAMAPVVPVVVLEDLDSAVPMAEALVSGGLPVIEVTLRTAVGLDAIRKMSDAVPGAVVGAGTVNRPELLVDSLEAGAKFIVSPGATPSLVYAARSAAVPYLPGAATASEMLALLEEGISHQKFFPAEASGGAPALKSFASPLPEVKFCPTGGIDAKRAADYLALPNVICVGGSWVTPSKLVKAGDWSAIEALARNAAKLGKG